jgi:hypothetical protein
MKLVIISILLLLFTGCSSFFYKPLAERKENCVERMIKLDVDGVDAARICTEVHKKK